MQPQLNRESTLQVHKNQAKNQLLFSVHWFACEIALTKARNHISIIILSKVIIIIEFNLATLYILSPTFANENSKNKTVDRERKRRKFNIMQIYAYNSSTASNNYSWNNKIILCLINQWTTLHHFLWIPNCPINGMLCTHNFVSIKK